MDTATNRASVALGAPGVSPMEQEIVGARRHAGALLPAIAELFQRAGTSLDDVEGVVLSDGPGSFTGLRVGASAAKALVLSRGLPLWTAPSLLVRAGGVARDGELVLSVADALRGEVFAAAYRFYRDRIETELVPSVQTSDVLLASGLQPDTIVGEVPPAIQAALERWNGQSVIGPPEGSPHAARLLELIHRPGGAQLVEQVREWEPAYGRPAEAQARWESVHGRAFPDSVGSPG
jgi:tRNA threonylcarbamoyladenosine biosynthesis protein TsaB